MIGEITNHLWQSTLFVLAAIVVAAALRKNGAHVRHAIWVAASVKFLIPFALLINLGSAVGSALARFAPPTTSPVSPAEAASADLSDVVDWVAQPFTSDVFVSAALPVESGIGWIAWPLAAAWACGFIAIVLLRLRGWHRVRAALRSSVPLPLAGPVPIRASAGLIEPGVVGIWRQVLLVPAGIEAQLKPAQLHAVLEHEYSHVRRRDNLTSAIHMVVEAVFWFHPLVWWVGARLIDERERACDEQVLRVCGEPQTYAESILNVCKLYVESPLRCVSGVTGSDLKKRIANIMINRVGRRLNFVGKAALAFAATLAFALPLAAGIVTAPADAAADSLAEAQSAKADATARQASSARFEVASIKPCDTNTPAPQPPARAGARSGGGPWYALTSPGYVYWHCATLAQLIPQAYASLDQPLLNVMAQPKIEDNFQPAYVKGGPSWVTADKFTIEVKAPLDMTAPALGGQGSRVLTTLPAAMSQALRSLLEDRFQLKVRRGTEPRDVYALTLAKGGLNKARVTTPVPGDCMTVEEYFASSAASAPLEERMKNAGKYRICGRTTTDIFASFTFNQLAVYFQNGGLLGDVVVNRTGVDTPYNFAMVLAPRTDGTAEERIARALEPLGLKLERIKAPADSLVIESVQKLRSDTSAFAPAFAPDGAKADASAGQAKFDVASIKPCDPSVPAPNAGVPAGGRRGGAPWFAMVSPGYVYWHCATLAQLIPQAYTTVDQPLQNTVMEVRFDEGNQPTYVKGGPSWVTSETFTIEAKASLDLTSSALAGSANRTLAALPPALSQALRSLLEDRFQLKVRRVTEERDVYAMTLAKGGLDPKRVTAPTPGDCQTTAEYFASPFGKLPLLEQAKALDSGLPRICGGILSMRNGRLQFTSVTLDKLAKDMSRQMDFVVVDQTGISTIVNFTLEIETYTAGTVEERFTRAAEQLGLKISRVKLPTEHLMIESVQKLRPNIPADR